MLASCAPVNNTSQEKIIKTQTISQKEIIKLNNIKKEKTKSLKEIPNKNNNTKYFERNFQKDVTIILSKNDNQEIVNQFINVIELAVYEKKIANISFSIKIYEDKNDLNNFIKDKDLAGRIFIGPLNSYDAEILHKYCSQGAVFFSFAAKKELAKNCVFLVNFFPENEIKTIFKFFPDNSRVAFLYPENSYGFAINEIIDSIADQSNSIIVNRASYNVNLSNATESIKELGKYELRKYELNRQKKILANKKDKDSKKRLKKLEGFKTTKDFDFTHIIIADYGLRLLQVAPLLPYYDIDPNIVRFVGTGAWDDEVFYDEPSLNGSIYPGIEFKKRQKLIDNYYQLYEEKLLRTSTLPYDIVGLLAYAINNNFTISSLYKMLEKSNLKFSGVDGNFYFLNNKIERELQILQINDGLVKVISK